MKGIKQSDPEVLRTVEELRTWRMARGRDLGLVMTMGALHEGHLDLVRALQKQVSTVLVSIFVNPTQFAPGEDYDAYPRTFEADMDKLSSLGVSAVFAPDPDQLYPPGQVAKVKIDPGPVAKILEGQTRPTHFAGVCQVVAKVFHLAEPSLAAFGQKDAQQLVIIEQMVRDLNFPVQIVPVKIRREEDGLAMSSRNQYLSVEDRLRAVCLWRVLQWVSKNINTMPPSDLVSKAKELLALEADQVDYVAMVQRDSYQSVNDDYQGQVIVALAAKIGDTRLIDNVHLSIERGEK